jgi:predicted nucleic acid-binding protein
VAITDRIVACRDSRDDKFIELAVNDHADLIVSGNRDPLALNPFPEIPIVAPRHLRAGRGAVSALTGG